MTSQFLELQNTWYQILKDNGFEDIEDNTLGLLKSWTADLTLNQDTVCSTVEPKTRLDASMLHHKRFNDVCKSMCLNKKTRLTPVIIKQILELHLDELAERAIAKILNIHHTLVHRTLTTLTDWSKVMPEESTEELAVVTRAYDDLDAPCLFSTWRNNLWFDIQRDENHADQFYKAANRHIKYILGEPDTKVRIACLKEDPDIILGYSVINKTNLEWVYVKEDYRNKGIATLLTKQAKTISIPATRLGEKIAKQKNLKTLGELSNEEREQIEESQGNC